MEKKENLIEMLLERSIDYRKTSFELAKLKALDKATEIGSSLVPHLIEFIFLASFMLFFNLGLAFWLGEILGKIYLGFALVAAFYGLIVIIIIVFFHKLIKKHVSNYFIHQILK